jgi:hypothetical protein
VNDLERDLRELFHEDARRVPALASAPEGLRRSARRRQAVFAGMLGLAGLAIVAGVVAGASLVLPLQEGPAPAAETTTETTNGITITYPENWVLLDEDPGAPSGTTPDLPRLVLVLSPSTSAEAIGCPGRVEADEPVFLMTVEERPLALDGVAARPWPVEPRLMRLETSAAGCYPDWEFRQARWTAAGRSFEGVIGFAPDVTVDDRTAVVEAFASMTFEPADRALTSVVLAEGTAGSEPWSLIASREESGLALTLEGESSATGFFGFDGTPDALQKKTRSFGKGSESQTVVFGPAPANVVRVEATWDNWSSAASADVIDVPDEIDADLNAYVLVIPAGGRIHVRGFDASGEMVIQGAADETGSRPDAALEDGTHFGYVRSVDQVAGEIVFDLAYFLTGEEANRAYQEETGETGPVPNDYFVDNDNPRLRTLLLAPDVRLRLLDWNECCETFFDGDLGPFAEAIQTQGDVIDGGRLYRGLSQWWITVVDGVVTQIEEQYTP